MSSTPPTPVGPPSWVKAIVSFLVAVQFFVIFTVITSAGSPNFPPSPVAEDLATLTRPYTQAFFMNNAYRFYAPEPGPTNLLWARFRYKDGLSRWMEMPRLEDFASRVPQQRYIALMLMFGNNTREQVVVGADGKEGADAIADPQAAIKIRFNPLGRICIASFVRHLARQPAYAHSYGQGAELESVEMYGVLHYFPLPDHTKAGWRYEDPRLYEVTFMGTYAPDGKLLPTESEFHQVLVIDELFAIRLVERDLLPYLEQQQVNPAADTALADAMERFGQPAPFRWPILRNRSLLQPQGREQLQKLFEQTLLDAETPGVREELMKQQRGSTPAQPSPTTQPTDHIKPTAAGPKKVTSPPWP